MQITQTVICFGNIHIVIKHNLSIIFNIGVCCIGWLCDWNIIIQYLRCQKSIDWLENSIWYLEQGVSFFFRFNCGEVLIVVVAYRIRIQSITSWLYVCVCVCGCVCVCVQASVIFPRGAIICFFFCNFFSRNILYENHHQHLRGGGGGCRIYEIMTNDRRRLPKSWLTPSWIIS